MGEDGVDGLLGALAVLVALRYGVQASMRGPCEVQLVAE